MSLSGGRKRDTHRGTGRHDAAPHQGSGRRAPHRGATARASGPRHRARPRRGRMVPHAMERYAGGRPTALCAPCGAPWKACSVSLCTVCNWAPHDESAHEGERCFQGHPLEVVGRYSNGRCRLCQKASSRRYRAANRLREIMRVRRWNQMRRGGRKPQRAKRSRGRQVPLAATPSSTAHLLIEDQDGPLIWIGQ
jgi:hypothetical protein